MFDSTHDAILLILALLYTIVGIARAIVNNPPRHHRTGRPLNGWFSLPFLIATALAITAVLW